MSEFEDIQRLIRLKRHEQPPSDFVEDFVRQFQQRQRSELLNNSARGLLWERINTYFEGLFAPSWRWAGATVAALAVVFLVFRPGSAPTDALADHKGGFEVRKFDYNDKLSPVSDAEVERYLISKHFEGGLGNEVDLQRGQASTHVPVQQDKLVPAGYIRHDIEVK